MRRTEEAGAAAARRAALAGAQYAAVEVPPGLGLDCGAYKWRQNQSHVELFVALPEGARASTVAVALAPGSISVAVDDRPVLAGRLYREIKAEESMWFVQDGVLEVTLLKRARRGHYEGGGTNADTFWRAVLRAGAPREALEAAHPPTAYYWAHCEDAPPSAPRLPPAARARAEEERRGAGTEGADAAPLVLQA
jgi:hypothetical protein